MPIELLRIEYMRLLELSPLWDRKVGVVQVTNLTEKVMEIRVLMSAESSGKAFDLRCYIRENMITYIQTNYPASLPKTRIEGIGYSLISSLATINNTGKKDNYLFAFLKWIV
jgi:hypothetical protein